MSTVAHVLVLTLGVAVTAFIVRLVAAGQLRSKYAVLWLSAAALLLPLAVVPSLLDTVANWLGFAYAPNLLFLVGLCFLFAVVVHFSWELTRLESRVRTLAEELALLRATDAAPPRTGTPR